MYTCIEGEVVEDWVTLKKTKQQKQTIFSSKTPSMNVLLQMWESLFQEFCNVFLYVVHIAGSLNLGGIEEGRGNLVLFNQSEHVGQNGRMHR